MNGFKPLTEEKKSEETDLSDSSSASLVSDVSNNKQKNFSLSKISPKDIKWSNLICFLIPVAMANFVHFICEGSLILLVPLFTIKIGKSEHLAGTLLGLGSLGAMISAPLAGYIANKTSAEFNFIFGACLRSITIFLCILTQNIYLWGLFMILYGISVSLILVGIQSFTSLYVPIVKRGRFSTIVMGLRRLGMVIGPLYSGFFLSKYNIKISLLVTNIISCIGLFIGCCLLNPPKYHSESNAGSLKNYLKSYRLTSYNRFNILSWINSYNENNNNNNNNSNVSHNKYTLLFVVRNYWKRLIMIGLYAFCQNYVRGTRRVIITFKASKLGYSDGKIGVVNSLSYIPDSLMFLLAGYIMDKYGRKFTSVPSLILFCTSLMIIPFVNNYNELVLVSLLFGFADGIVFDKVGINLKCIVATGLLLCIGADIAPFECRSQFLGIYRFITTIPTVLSVSITGYLVSYTNILIACLFSVFIGIFGIVWMGCILEDPIKTGKRLRQLAVINNDLSQLNLTQNKHLQLELINTKNES